MAKKITTLSTVTNIQLNILEALARYKYLTFSQLLKLDIGTTQYQYLWKQMVGIRDSLSPLVNCHNYAVPHPRIGKSESMYYLSHVGKLFLENELGLNSSEIKFQKGNTIIYRDYHHRKKQIDFHISLDRFINDAGLDILYFNSYFDKTGNSRRDKNLKSINRIKLDDNIYFIPDAIFKIANRNNDEQLFLFEMCNGKDSKRILKQIHNHAKAIVSKEVHIKEDISISQPYKILFLFSNPAILKSVYDRVSIDGSLAQLKKYFLFQDYNKLEYGDFFETWMGGDGELKSILDINKAVDGTT